MVAHPAPPQTRTCAMHAYGSSSRASAAPGWQSNGGLVTRLVSAKSLSCVCPLERSARRRLPSRGSLGPRFPTFTGTMRRYDCHRSLSGRFTCRSLPDTLRAPRDRGVPEGLAVWSKRPNGARAFGHPVPRSGHVVKETDGSPKFPSSPCEDMPRSQTPVVSCSLALTRAGLRPSRACKPSAHHDYTHFGAPSRGLPSRYTRLRTAPYGEARGFAPDLLARR